MRKYRRHVSLFVWSDVSGAWKVKPVSEKAAYFLIIFSQELNYVIGFYTGLVFIVECGSKFMTFIHVDFITVVFTVRRFHEFTDIMFVPAALSKDTFIF